METTIEIYSIGIRRKRKKSDICFADENDVPDIYDLLKTKLVKHIDDVAGDIPAEKKIVRIKNSTPENLFWGFDDQTRTIWGILESGKYGKKYNFVSKDAPKVSLFTAGKDQAPMMPFFYYIMIPNSGDKALLILERTDGQGIHSVMHQILCGLFQKYYPKDTKKKDPLDQNLFTINHHPVITADYRKLLTDGRPRTVKLTLETLPTDTAEKYHMEQFDSKDVSIELSIKLKSSMDDNIAKSIARNPRGLLMCTPITDFFDSADQKTITDIDEGGKKQRTSYIGSDRSPRPYYSIEVIEDQDGHSDLASILSSVNTFIEANEDFNVFKTED